MNDMHHNDTGSYGAQAGLELLLTEDASPGSSLASTFQVHILTGLVNAVLGIKPSACRMLGATSPVCIFKKH